MSRNTVHLGRVASARWIGLLLLGLLTPPTGPAAAEEWSFVGARYQGMGGAGVAVVDDEHAPYWNPGALAFTKSYGLSLPVGAQASAEGSVIADVDRVARYLDELGSGDFDQLIDDIENGNPLDLAQAQTVLALAVDALPGLDQPGKGLYGSVNASLLGRYQRVALTGIGLGYFGADPVFDRENLSVSELSGGAAVDQLVDPIASTARYSPGPQPDVASQLEAIFSNLGSSAPIEQAEELVFQAELAGINVNDSALAQNLLDLVDATVNTSGSANSFANNNSGAFVRGLAVEEIGVAYGHPFWKDRIGIGANVKYMYGTTFNQFIRYDDIDDGGDLLNEVTGADRRKTTHTGSVDLGVLARPFPWLRFGLTARNVTKPSFDLARDPSNPTGRGELSLDPQVRAGAALWLLPNWVVAFDADLTKNESALLDGFESRIVSLGTEFKIPIWKLGLALRGGAYLNTASDDNDAIALTGGLGLRFFDFNLDLAGGASPKTQRVEAANDQEIPARVAFSATLSFRREF